MRRIAEIAIVVFVAAIASASPALAGNIPPATPAPVIGLGIPAIAAFGLLYKRLRGRKDQ